MEVKYNKQKVNIASVDDFFIGKEVYSWSYIRQYNYHRIKSDIYIKKGAFSNLGFLLKKVIKTHFQIDNEVVLLDLVKVEDIQIFKNLTASDLFPDKIGFFLLDKDQEEDIQLYLSYLKKILLEYFMQSKNNNVSTYINLFFPKAEGILFKIINKLHLTHSLLYLSRINNEYLNFSLDKNEKILYGFPEKYIDCKNNP